MQNIWNFIVRESRVYKKWQILAIIQEISDSNLETRRWGSKSGVSRIIWESWQHSMLLFHAMSLIRIVPKRQGYNINFCFYHLTTHN